LREGRGGATGGRPRRRATSIGSRKGGKVNNLRNNRGSAGVARGKEGGITGANLDQVKRRKANSHQRRGKNRQKKSEKIIGKNVGLGRLRRVQKEKGEWASDVTERRELGNEVENTLADGQRDRLRKTNLGSREKRQKED